MIVQKALTNILLCSAGHMHKIGVTIWLNKSCYKVHYVIFPSNYSITNHAIISYRLTAMRNDCLRRLSLTKSLQSQSNLITVYINYTLIVVESLLKHVNVYNQYYTLLVQSMQGQQGWPVESASALDTKCHAKYVCHLSPYHAMLAINLTSS